MDKFKLALFGAGRIGKIHAATIAANPDCKLEAIVDIYEPAAQELAKKYAAKVKTTQEVFNDPHIDGVLICSATNTHADLIEMAARANKAIFCEKPIDLNLDRVKSCLKIVKEHKASLSLGFNRRFDSNFIALKQALDAGKIGKAELITISSRDPEPPPLEYIKVSGGIFKDMMIHDFDIAVWLKAEMPIAVSARASCLVNPEIAKYNDYDTAVVSLEFADGSLAVITNSRRASYGYDQRLEVHGELGMLSMENILENTVSISNKDGSNKAKPLYFFLERYMQAYANELNSFVDCFKNNQQPEPSGKDGENALILAIAAQESVRTAKTIAIKS